MKVDNELLLSIFVAVEGAHAFSAFMPSAFTIRKFCEDGQDRSKLRAGYAPAILFNLTLAGAVAGMVRSIKPLVAAALVIVFMLVMYEGSLSSVEGEV